jgi:hypothetical protein
MQLLCVKRLLEGARPFIPTCFKFYSGVPPIRVSSTESFLGVRPIENSTHGSCVLVEVVRVDRIPANMIFGARSG